MFKATHLEAETVRREPQLPLRLRFPASVRDLQIRRVLKPVALNFGGEVFDGMWYLAENFPGAFPASVVFFHH